MKKIIITNYDKKLLEALKGEGYEPLCFEGIKLFDSFLRYHTDIFYCNIKDTLFVSDLADSSFLRDVKNLLTVTTVKEGYPYEASLNCFSIDKFLVCNKLVVSGEILNFAQKNNMDVIHVNQGYAKCSVATVGEKAVITEDDGIEQALLNRGIQVLKIPKGTVSLKGFDYGFIGGSSFYDSSKKTVYFFGDIELNPYAKEIMDFCNKQGTDVVSLLKKTTLNDYGSAVLL